MFFFLILVIIAFYYTFWVILKLALDLFKGYLWRNQLVVITTIPLPFINPKWSEQGRYDLEETVVTSYDLNKLEIWEYSCQNAGGILRPSRDRTNLIETV